MVSQNGFTKWFLLLIVLIITSCNNNTGSPAEVHNPVVANISNNLTIGQLHNEAVLYYLENCDTSWKFDNPIFADSIATIFGAFTKYFNLGDSATTFNYIKSDIGFQVPNNDFGAFYYSKFNSIINDPNSTYFLAPIEKRVLIQTIELLRDSNWIVSCTTADEVRTKLYAKTDSLLLILSSNDSLKNSIPTYGFLPRSTIDIARNSFDLWSGHYSTRLKCNQVTYTNSKRSEKIMGLGVVIGVLVEIAKAVAIPDAAGALFHGIKAVKTELEGDHNWDSGSQYRVTDKIVNGAASASTYGTYGTGNNKISCPSWEYFNKKDSIARANKKP